MPSGLVSERRGIATLSAERSRRREKKTSSPLQVQTSSTLSEPDHTPPLALSPHLVVEKRSLIRTRKVQQLLSRTRSDLDDRSLSWRSLAEVRADSFSESVGRLRGERGQAKSFGFLDGGFIPGHCSSERRLSISYLYVHWVCDSVTGGDVARETWVSR